MRINEDTLYNVFSEAEKRGNQEAAAIAAELRPRVMEAREKANLKEQIDDVKDQWQDVLEDIIKGGLGIED